MCLDRFQSTEGKRGSCSFKAQAIVRLRFPDLFVSEALCTRLEHSTGPVVMVVVVPLGFPFCPTDDFNQNTTEFVF